MNMDLEALLKIPKLVRGTVVKINGAQKMIKIAIVQRRAHAAYGKIVAKTTKLNVHWEGEQSLTVGDVVEVMESRPLSRVKRHVFVRKV